MSGNPYAVDLERELGTRKHRPRSLTEKANAGFSVYVRTEDTTKLRRVLDQREITTVISSL